MTTEYEMFPYGAAYDDSPIYTGDTTDEAISALVDAEGWAMASDSEQIGQEVEVSIYTRPRFCPGWEVLDTEDATTCACGDVDSHEPAYSRAGRCIGLSRLVSRLSVSPCIIRIYEDRWEEV